MLLTEEGKLGFGCMRLPMRIDAPGLVDTKEMCAMVDRFLAAGFRYFDTATWRAKAKRPCGSA